MCTCRKSVPLGELVCMPAQNRIRGCECVFLCFNVCCSYCFCCIPWCDCSMHVCACVGTSYNTMNVDIVKPFCFFFVFFFLQRSLVIFLFLPAAVVSLVTRKRIIMTMIPWLSFWVHRQWDENTATINCLIVMDWRWSVGISSLSETKPAWTI